MIDVVEVRDRERLMALARYEILDTSPEQAYDDIVRVAAHICSVPMALVTLVAEERQWFKAKIGFEDTETPIEYSFCRYALQSDRLMIVPDARRDVRFSDYPCVTSAPHVRFYAGAPLIDPDGHTLGTLCVIDQETRVITVEQQDALTALSRQVMAQLELRRKNRELTRLATSHAKALSDVERHVQALRLEIEQRERAEMLQHESELRFRSIFRSAKTGMFVADSSRRVVLWNPAAYEMFGYREREILNKDFAALFAESDWETLMISGGMDGASSVQLSAIRKDGTRFPVEVSLAAWSVDNDAYCSAMISDITRRKAIERMKDEFVSNVSHELRTPLTSIKGSLCLIDSGIAGPLSEDVKKLNGIALKSTERLIRMINDLLDTEKLASGKTEFHYDRVRLSPIIEDALQEVKSFADQFGVAIDYTKSDLIDIVRADRDRIVQVLTNLLSNAVKASTSGQTVTVSTRADEKNVRIAVTDRGSGIPASFRDHIFERFTQADSSDTRKKGGTGLGLNIVRGIVQSHGGSVSFETSEGVGTTFFVDLPLDCDPVDTL